MTVIVAAFYKFVSVEDPPRLREQLRALTSAHDIRGTILVAAEGINGTISGPPDDLAAVLAALRADPRFGALTTKEAAAAEHPFRRLKVKLKREILTLRRPEADPTKLVGTYVDPTAWNALLDDPEVVLIDTRNNYEIAEGTFPGAINPGTRHFGQFPAYVASNLDPLRHKKVAMFCTGGIRCEKASAYLLAHGFEQVFHLKGGILAYLAQVPQPDSRWEGTCFVFDERESVGGGADERDDEDAAETPLRKAL